MKMHIGYILLVLDSRRELLYDVASYSRISDANIAFVNKKQFSNLHYTLFFFGNNFSTIIAMVEPARRRAL